VKRIRRWPRAAIPLCLGVALGACSFIDRFPDVEPDPDPTTTSGGTGGAGPTTTSGVSESASGTSTGAGMGGASTSSTTATSSTSSTTSTTATSVGSSGSGERPCVPSFELCATAADEDCDGLGCVGASIAWARFGDVGDQRAKAIAAAGSDAILVGVAVGAVDLGGGALPDLGDPLVNDLILARYTATLSTLWQKRFADTAAGGVAVSPGGDVLVAGGAIGDVDFGGGVLTGVGAPAQDVVVARFDGSGKHLWSHRWGDAADQIANAVAVDAQGNVVVTGGFAGKLAIGPAAPLTVAGTTDLFVAKLDAAGNPLWRLSGGGAANVAQGRAIAVDSAGNSVIAGFFTGTIQLGGQTLVSQGNDDIVVAKLGPAGTPLWTRTFGGAGADRAFGVAVDPADAVLITGGFRGAVTFGALPPITGPSLNDTGSFLVKLDPGGTPLWVRSQSEPAGMNVGTDQQGFGVDVDAEGNAVITGFASGTTVFDVANPVTSARVAVGSTDAFIAKYGPEGALIWARLFGDPSAQVGVAAAVGPLGSVWSTGFFVGSMDFGASPPGVLTSAGGLDIFLARLSP
jgi:hypothetical protein